MSKAEACRPLGLLNESMPGTSSETGETGKDVNAKQIKQMESIEFDKIFDERGDGTRRVEAE